MSRAIPLKNIAIYTVEELIRAQAVSKSQAEGVTFQSVELRLAFATADGAYTVPIVDVGDLPLNHDEAARRLAGMSGLAVPVYVDQANLGKAKPAQLGQLVMRIIV